MRILLLICILLTACATAKSPPPKAMATKEKTQRSEKVPGKTQTEGSRHTTVTDAAKMQAFLLDYDRGASAFRAEKWSEAAGVFDRMIQAHPDKILPRYARAVISLRTGDCAKAAPQLSAAIAQKPDFAEAYMALGYCQRVFGRYGDAERSYLAAIRYKPDLAATHVNLGILYEIYLSDREKALNSYRDYLKWARSESEKRKEVSRWVETLTKQTEKARATSGATR